jgi:endonuclease YncB( thermonuclease family)
MNLKLLLFFLLFLIFFLNYTFLNKVFTTYFEDLILEEQKGFLVTSVTDGDTIKIGNQTIRLLGINTPEKGEPYYQEAKEYLSSLILGEEIQLKYGKQKYDKYQRILAYVFLNNTLINIKLIEQGYANPYFFEKEDFYYEKFILEWEKCKIKNKNLCSSSSSFCRHCIELKSFSQEQQFFEFKNVCNFSCNLTSWTLHGQGRRKFNFPQVILSSNKSLFLIIGNKTSSENILYWDEVPVFSKTDSIYLRDELGKLVWEINY